MAAGDAATTAASALLTALREAGGSAHGATRSLIIAPHKICNNETLLLGVCYGMPVCGFCYDFGQFYRPSREYEIFNLTVIGVLLPMLGVFGLIGNCVNAFVFSRKSMHSSLNAYLCALAFSDMTIVFTSFFLFFLENMRKRSSSIQVSKCYALLAPIMFPLGLTAQTLSVFLTLAGAFDCFVLVTAGERLRRACCTMRTSKRAIAGILVAACCFNLPHLFEIIVVNCWSVPYQQPGYDVCPTALRQNETYYKWYYAYLYTIVMAAGPVVLLVVLNAAIIVSMRRKYSSIATKVATPPRKKSAPALPEYWARRQRRRTARGERRLAALAACQSVPCDFCYRQQKTRSLGDASPAANGAASWRRERLTLRQLDAGASDLYRANESDGDSLASAAFDAELANYFARAAPPTRLTGAPPPSLAPLERRATPPVPISAPASPKANQTTDVMTLVLVVFLFISCNVMPLTLNFLELLFNLVNSYLIDLSNLMVVLNSSCNIVIYYVFCESYRLTLHKHFRKVRRRVFGRLFAPPKRHTEDRCLLTGRHVHGVRDGRAVARRRGSCRSPESSTEYGSTLYAYAERPRRDYRQRGGGASRPPRTAELNDERSNV